MWSRWAVNGQMCSPSYVEPSTFRREERKMPRHRYSIDKLIPGAQGPAVLRYRSVIAWIASLEERGYQGPLVTPTFVSACGKEGRYYDMLRHLRKDYWRAKRERLRYICAVTPSTLDCRLYAAHLLWQHDLPDLRWIAGWLIQHSGRDENQLANHILWEGKPRFAEAVVSDVLDGLFELFQHPHGRIDLRISEYGPGDQARVPATEYLAEHLMTDETFVFESPFSRGPGWQPPAESLQ
jgi:hypothetical protein